MCSILTHNHDAVVLQDDEGQNKLPRGGSSWTNRLHQSHRCSHLNHKNCIINRSLGSKYYIATKDHNTGDQADRHVSRLSRWWHTLVSTIPNMSGSKYFLACQT